MSKQRVDTPFVTRRKGRVPSIKSRIRRMVLVPSILLVVLALAGSAYEGGHAFYVRAVAVSVRQVSIPAVDALTSLESERRLSMALLTKPAESPRPLAEQRHLSDRRLGVMRSRADAALAHAPQKIKTRVADLTDYLNKLPAVRKQVDAGTIRASAVFTFYNDLLDSATRLFNTQARIVPDVTATQGGIAATDLFRLGDLMSRAGSQAATAFAAHRFDASDFNSFAQLVGAYHSQLTIDQPNLVPEVQDGIARLQAGDDWAKLVAAENVLLARGPWSDGVPGGLPVTGSQWNRLATTVSDELTALAKQQADVVSGRALSSSNWTLLYVILGSLLALAVAVAAMVWSLRQSTGLVVQLASLRDQSRGLVEQLPGILRRVREGATEDTDTEVHGLDDFRPDEIGQVAAAFREAQGTAVAAAVQEADGREATRKLLVGIARRVQRPLRQLLEQLKGLQNKETDPERLGELFKLDHLAALLLRNVENLVILGGARPGRRWREPVPLDRVVRAAVGETAQYQRVSVQAVPDDLDVDQNAVAEVIHMVADLLDNALQFSSPQSPVLVRSSRVARGIVIEIEDQGFGMAEPKLSEFNRLLQEAPTFNVRDLGDASQLGMWVIASLAHQLNGKVHLRESPYGGVLAIVLLPPQLFDMPAETPVTAPPADSPAEASWQSQPQPVPYAGDHAADDPLPPPLPLRVPDTASTPTTADWPTSGPAAGTPLSDDPTPLERFTAHGGLPRNGADADEHAAPPRHLSRPSPHPTATPPPTGRFPVPAAATTPAPAPPPPPPPAPAALPELPTRVPQASLVSELRDGDAPADPAFDDWSDVDARSPEDIRASLSGFQTGTRRGREES